MQQTVVRQRLIWQAACSSPAFAYLSLPSQRPSVGRLRLVIGRASLESGMIVDCASSEANQRTGRWLYGSGFSRGPAC